MTAKVFLWPSHAYAHTLMYSYAHLCMEVYIRGSCRGGRKEGEGGQRRREEEREMEGMREREKKEERKQERGRPFG